MTNTANDTAAAPINVTCTEIVHVPNPATAAPRFKRAVINDRSGGKVLTVRFYNAAPLEIYCDDALDAGVTEKHILTIGRTAGLEGVTGLFLLGVTDADPLFPLIMRTAETLRM